MSRLLHLVRTQVPLGEFVATLVDLGETYGTGTYVQSTLRGLEVRTSGRICGCLTCQSEEQSVAAAAGADPFFGAGRMILCDTCGNKRCPRATNHTEACTASNEPGQPGSAYQ